jgi:pimeloyl-ACP methyl ester carboxylesterase
MLFRRLSWRLLLLAISGSLPVFAASSTQEQKVVFDECLHDFPTPPGAECGVLSVPENPRSPSGERINLSILKVPATIPSSRAPVFVVVGGPGGSAVRSAQQYLPFFHQLRRERDIVFVDQRGTGLSNGLTCDFGELQFALISGKDGLRAVRDEVARCAASLPADLTRYTTPYAVWDLEQIREALGYPHINLWGVSYGTRVLLQYMRSYPEAVRAAVLDGVAPVAIQLPRFAEDDASNALDALLDLCQASPPCAERFSGLRSQWLGLLQELETEPVPVVLRHPRSQKAVPVSVSAVTLSNWVRLALYSRELAPILPMAMARAVEGDFGPLGNTALLAVENIADQVSQGMQMAVLCAEDQSHPFAEDIAAPKPEERLLQLDKPEVFQELCKSFPQGKLKDAYFEPVESNVPTLLLSGALDPVTPPHWAERVAMHLGNSKHLVAPGAHHGVTMHGCATRLVYEFFDTASLAAIEPDCVRAIAPPAFFVDPAGPAMEAPEVIIHD